MNNEDQNRLDLALKESSKEIKKDQIGLLSEHTLHRTLKYFITLDESKHEIKLQGKIADIYLDNIIYEVQTKSFNLMRPKLKVFLKDYDVVICYPLAQSKVIHMYDNDSLLYVKNSPKHAKPLEMMKELYKIKSSLNDSHLHFKIFMLKLDEHRSIDHVKRYHGKGYTRINQIPKEIIEIIDINQKEDFLKLINLNIETPFTSSTFARANKVNQRIAQMTLNILTYLELVERIGKKGNSYLYVFKKII